MAPDRESLTLLRRLHERVFADADVRAALDAGFSRLALELDACAEAPHATCIVPVELFRTDLVVESECEGFRLCRLFLLRRGARMAVPERHLNSVQRLVSYRGSGAIHQGVPGVPGPPHGLRPRAICSPGGVAAHLARHGEVAGPADLARHTNLVRRTSLARHWDIVPPGVWHFPEAAVDRDWATVTFHSAAEDEIVDEYHAKPKSDSP